MTEPGKQHTADIIVLGLGPGGVQVASQLAEAGLEVIGLDGGLVGGECQFWGCTPSKMMVRAANLLAEARRVGGASGAPEMAGIATVNRDWGPVAARIRDEATHDWTDAIAVDALVEKGVRFIRGWGRLDGPGRVIVGDLELQATKGVVVDTGTRPWTPPIPGLEGLPYWTNRDAIKTTAVPDSLVVLGGSATGVELAQVFARFGSKVTIVEKGERLVTLEEPEASHVLEAAFARDGIEVICDAHIANVTFEGGQFLLHFEGKPTVASRHLLVAAGRHSDLAAISAATVGIDERAKYIPIDLHMRAGEKLWAIGDVTGKGAFTHISHYQAGVAVADILGHEGVVADYRAIPRVTFTDPEIGSVGMTESVAREHGIKVKTGFFNLPDSPRGWLHKVGNEGLIKVVEDSARQVLVGATSVGPCGGEVLSMLTLAVHAEIPTNRLRHMIYAFPTFHGAVQQALHDLAAP